MDYKSGTLPSHKDICSGKSPQMPLLGLLLTQKLNALDPASFDASFWTLEPGLSSLSPIKNFSQAIDQVEGVFYDLLERFYGTACHPYKATRSGFDPFPTLSRQQEWSGVLSHFFQMEETTTHV